MSAHERHQTNGKAPKQRGARRSPSRLKPTARQGGLLVAAALGLAAASALAASALTLVDGGQPRAVIVIGLEASAQAREAAAEFQAVLLRITGATLPLLERAPEESRAKVLVGQAAAREAAGRLGLTIPAGLKPDFDDEGYVVATAPGTLILAGNETEPYQGTFSAVYDVLHTLGCRWFFPGEFGEVLPRLSTVTVPTARRVARPALRVRDVWYSGHLPVSNTQSADFTLWKRRNRFCRPGFWSPGGPFLQNPTDDSTYRLLPKEQYWAAHPEFYSLNPDGTRNERFLCMSHPGAIQAAADTVIEYFRAHPDHYAFAFSPPDEPVLCHCAECTVALHGAYGGEGYGDVSDPYFRFVFDLADRVGRSRPDRWIISMAYYNRCRPPQGVQGKRKNLLIQLASIQQCDLHSYAERQCWSRQLFGHMLRHWSELTAGQVFYEYDPHDWSHLQRPAWRSQGIAEDLRLLKQVGGWGFSNEGQMAWLSTGLNYYLHGRLAWQLDQEPADVIDDFARRFFGPAAKPMRDYYTSVETALRTANTHYPIGFDPDGPGEDVFSFLTRPLLDRCGGLLRHAAGLATAEPFHRRVAVFQAHYDRLDAASNAREAMARGDYHAAAQCATAMIASVARVQDTMLLQDIGPYGGRLAGTNLWRTAMQAAALTDGTEGRLVAVLPERALFRTDEAPDGVVQRWYTPNLQTQGWRTVRLTAGWQNQGFTSPDGLRFKGTAWYRCDLTLSEAPDPAARLCLPEVKGTAAWVWCNGDFAGYWERTKQGPRHLGLAGLLRPGRNLLVFRVRGEGGLTLPPFVYVPVAAKR